MLDPLADADHESINKADEDGAELVLNVFGVDDVQNDSIVSAAVPTVAPRRVRAAF